MSKFILTNVRLWTGGGDLSGDTNSVAVDATIEDKDVTNFNSQGWHERIGGLGTASFKCAGYWEAGSLSFPDDNFWANLGLTTGISVAPTGPSSGSPCYLTNALLDKDSVFNGKVGDVAAFEAQFDSTWPLVSGYVGLSPATPLTATGTGSVLQLGAVATGKNFYAHLNVNSVSGTTPSITVTVQSANNSGMSGATTRLTFTAATAQASQILRVAGPITDTYWQVSYTISGTNPSFLASVAMGIK